MPMSKTSKLPCAAPSINNPDSSSSCANRTASLRRSSATALSAARIADLRAPGQVLLRLAVAGFGVVLPPPA